MLVTLFLDIQTWYQSVLCSRFIQDERPWTHFWTGALQKDRMQIKSPPSPPPLQKKKPKKKPTKKLPNVLRTNVKKWAQDVNLRYLQVYRTPIKNIINKKVNYRLELCIDINKNWAFKFYC